MPEIGGIYALDERHQTVDLAGGGGEEEVAGELDHA